MDSPELQLPDDLPAIEADETQMQQIVMNLITNASESLEEGESGVVTVTAGSIECTRQDLSKNYLDENLPEGKYVFLDVRDTGCGMDEKTKAKLFDPFYTTKFTGRSLGMAAVLGIVRGHKGAVVVDSTPGQGTTFRILLPVFTGKAPKRSADAWRMASAEWKGNGTVLEVAQRMLERLGFAVVTASDGREAVELFRERAAEIRCVVLDLTMPEMDGEEAYLEMRRIRPETPVVLSSGYREDEIAQRFAGQGLAGFIQKPYASASLTVKLKADLGG